MATRVFSKEELAQLRGFPEITRDELIRFFTLTAADQAFVDPGRGRSPRDRLGLAIQLCTLPWLGFVPDEVTAAPPVAGARLARQLQIARRSSPGIGTVARPAQIICGWGCGMRGGGRRECWSSRS
jgi:hypothetical protein